MDSFMLAEIKEQPEAVRRTIRDERANLERIAAEIQKTDPALILIAARGTSDNAATYAKYLWGLYTGLPVALAAPSLTTLYRAKLTLSRAVVIGISQSGESTDIVETIRAARAAGALTIAVTSNAASTLAQAANETALCRSGVERSVAATKTYTTQLAVLAALIGLQATDSDLLAALERVPDALSAVVDQEAVVNAVAQQYQAMQGCVVVGRGINYCTALETALKLKETSYVLAEPYSAADFQHGPIAIVDAQLPILLFAVPGHTLQSMSELAANVCAKGAQTIVFSSASESLQQATSAIQLPPAVADTLAGEAVSPLIYAVAGQLFAHALCRLKGYDPDHPRGLHKVTLTL